MEHQKTQPVEIVVFDFDGTSISGNSPVILVRTLLKQQRLQKRVVARIALWGIAYKLRLPQNESWVRGAVFSAFEGYDQSGVDAFLEAFYRDHLEQRFRPKAHEAIQNHRAQGREVWVVSATFEPIAREAMKHHGYTRCFATRMATDSQGRYTRFVEGLPLEGQEKLVRVIEYANKTYGQGKWVLTHAYGDHHSDRALLEAAQHPYAVTPDRPLRRIAKRKGWPILEW